MALTDNWWNQGQYGWADNRLPSATPAERIANTPQVERVERPTDTGMMDGDSFSTLTSQPDMSEAERARAGQAVGGLAKDMAGRAAKAGFMGALAGAPTDALVGGALKASFNPAGMVSGIGDMAWGGAGFAPETLGFSDIMAGRATPNQFVGTVAKNLPALGLGLINPALGMMAGLVGTPLASAVQDAMDTRDMEEARDALEEGIGWGPAQSYGSNLARSHGGGYAVTRGAPGQGLGVDRFASVPDLVSFAQDQRTARDAGTPEWDSTNDPFGVNAARAAQAAADDGISGTARSSAEHAADQQARDAEAMSMGVHSSQTGRGSGTDAGTAGGGRIICSELVRQGLIPAYERRIEEAHTLRHKSDTSIRGYHIWAQPVVAKMKKSKKFTKLWLWVMKHRNNEIKRIMKGEGKHDYIGKALRAVLEPFSYMVGLCSTVDPVDERFNRSNQNGTNEPV